jgi:hypothetical protein
MLAGIACLTLGGVAASDTKGLARIIAIAALAAAAVVGSRLASATTFLPAAGILLGVWFLVLDAGASVLGGELEVQTHPKDQSRSRHGSAPAVEAARAEPRP